MYQNIITILHDNNPRHPIIQIQKILALIDQSRNVMTSKMYVSKCCKVQELDVNGMDKEENVKITSPGKIENLSQFPIRYTRNYFRVFRWLFGFVCIFVYVRLMIQYVKNVM